MSKNITVEAKDKWLLFGRTLPSGPPPESDGMTLREYIGLLAHRMGKTAELPSGIVQVLNPRINRYVKIDRSTGRILCHKDTPGPFVGIPIVETKPVSSS